MCGVHDVVVLHEIGELLDVVSNELVRELGRLCGIHVGALGLRQPRVEPFFRSEPSIVDSCESADIICPARGRIERTDARCNVAQGQPDPLLNGAAGDERQGLRLFERVLVTTLIGGVLTIEDGIHVGEALARRVGRAAIPHAHSGGFSDLPADGVASRVQRQLVALNVRDIRSDPLDKIFDFG